jgi:hypothetical protein
MEQIETKDQLTFLFVWIYRINEWWFRGKRKNGIITAETFCLGYQNVYFKLRPNDSVRLVTFNNQGQVMFKPVFKSHFDNINYDLLDQMVTNGGTTIKSGFTLSKQLLLEFIKDNECVNCENGIIMLTDVGDNSL